MFCASMISSLALILLTYAVACKIVWLTYIGWALLMIATFLAIKVECKRMDKDREYENKIEQLEKQIEYRDDVLSEFTNAYGSLDDKVDYLKLKIKELSEKK